MNFFKAVLFLLLSITVVIFSQNVVVKETSDNSLEVEISFPESVYIKDTLVNGTNYQIIKSNLDVISLEGEPTLPGYEVQLAVPFNKNYNVKVISSKQKSFNNVFLLPYADEVVGEEYTSERDYNKSIYAANNYFPANLIKDQSDYQFRDSKVLRLTTAPFQFNPVSRKLKLTTNIKLKVTFTDKSNRISYRSSSDSYTKKILKDVVKNPDDIAKWQARTITEKTNVLFTEWYDPAKRYANLYLNTKSITKVTYEQLVNAGYSLGEPALGSIQLFNDSEEVPIDLFDVNEDGAFNEGDYFYFLGYPPTPTPYCKSNIYNNSNVYWFTADGANGKRFTEVDAFPHGTATANYKTVWESRLFEEDKFYDRLGYAPDDHRDYWLWETISGNNGVAEETQRIRIEGSEHGSDEYIYRVKMGLQGRTTNDHRVLMEYIDQPIADTTWNGVNDIVMETEFQLDTLVSGPILLFDINAIGPNDDIKTNWFELSYKRLLRVFDNELIFTGVDEAVGNEVTYEIWHWDDEEMFAYAKETGEKLYNTYNSHNEYRTFRMQHNASEKCEYFVYGDQYEPPTVDSIKINVNNSDLRNHANGADYIIISYKEFLPAANTLADFRKTRLEGYSEARTMVVDVQDIYNEFSGGLLDPWSIKEFIKYAYDNYQEPKPKHIVLVGDMSYDYRGLLEDSEPSFMPSIPYHSNRYGTAVSDNQFVTIIGDDPYPDLTIGRLSCETPEEANVLVDKIVNYPQSGEKSWRQDALLIGAGQSASDEDKFGFNNESTLLEDEFIAPEGYRANKIFTFANEESHEPYIGSTLEIRQAFNNGVTLANFYGHAGTYQWDKVFLIDDIELLENYDKYPFITSITCYTAHFDNQKVFGEVFNLKPNTGSIAFAGQTGLTYWTQGKTMNRNMYQAIYSDGMHELGTSLLQTKLLQSQYGAINRDQINLLTLLGDPGLTLALPDKPDFQLSQASISLSSNTPVTGDSIDVFVELYNVGRIYADSLTAKLDLYVNAGNGDSLIGTKNVEAFGEYKTVSFGYRTVYSGVHTFRAEINQDNAIEEDDLSDNIASRAFSVFSLNEPSIIKPLYGAVLTNSLVQFEILDVGEYLEKELVYQIQIDTSMEFESPLFTADDLRAGTDGAVTYERELNQEIKYFWRARIYDGDKFSNWSDISTFSIDNTVEDFKMELTETQLLTADIDELDYNENEKLLEMRRELNVPEPTAERIIKNAEIELPDDIQSLSAIATDGDYVYFAHNAYYARNNGYEEASNIYRMGTGFNNTVWGQIEGPIANDPIPVWKNMFAYDGDIYVADGSSYYLVKVDLETGDTSHVNIAAGLLNALSGDVSDGGAYLNTDGEYVYNLATQDTSGANIYTLRTFDPKNNWELVREDYTLNGTSYSSFTSFFIAKGYIYMLDRYSGNLMRRINLETGVYEEEWAVKEADFLGYFGMDYDRENDLVYGSVYYNDEVPAITMFQGSYFNSEASFETQAIGPANSWDNISYNLISSGSMGTYNASLLGLNENTRNWDTLKTKLGSSYSLAEVNPKEYKYIRYSLNMADTSLGLTAPLKLKSLTVDYTPIPEIIVSENYLSFSPDSLLQGFDIELSTIVRNAGYSKADSVVLEYTVNNDDSVLYKTEISVEPFDTTVVKFPINTSRLLMENMVTVQAKYDNDYYTFNNIAKKDFYVSRDSVRPSFNITFDGREIINNDIVSVNPEIKITLSDEGPLPIIPDNFDLSHIFYGISEKLQFDGTDSLTFDYTPYPNSEAVVTWKPNLEDGSHTLSVAATDASLNPYSNTYYTVTFNVDSENKIEDIYNYPNPFSGDTYFTFTLKGNNVPEELRIKIYTVAGRMIREITVPPSELGIKYLNKIYWDGRDEDGDEVANGTYLYKVIAKYPDKTFSETGKMARVR